MATLDILNVPGSLRHIVEWEPGNTATIILQWYSHAINWVLCNNTYLGDLRRPGTLSDALWGRGRGRSIHLWCGRGDHGSQHKRDLSES